MNEIPYKICFYLASTAVHEVDRHVSLEVSLKTQRLIIQSSM